MTTADAPPTSPRRATQLLSRSLAVCLFAALHAHAAYAQSTASEDVIETAQTPAGELSVVRRRAPDDAVTIVVKLGEKVLAEKEGGYRTAGIHGTYPARAPRYALIELTEGGLTCASKFAIVDLSREGAARVTEDFGNCGVPRAAYRGGTLTVTFPAGPRKHDPGSYYVGPGQVWSYGAGRLRLVRGRRSRI
ncbi:MAG TPA: hypothetical protein VF736_09015 [Pyrinomonadaceae bacterium]|jgi:hypothetical protein